MANFKSLCTPAQIYLVLAILSIIIASFTKFHILAIIFKVIFALVWAWFLNFLCSNGLTSVSWFLVLLPYIIILLALLGLIYFKSVNDKKQQHPHQQ